MRTINALGFIEVYGLVAGIEAADAMLKTAQVRILREHGVNPGLISLVVEGDLAACRAAVDAGVAAASQIGRVVSSHVIGRPDADTETMIMEMLRVAPDKPEEPAAKPESAAPAEAPAATAVVPPQAQPEVKADAPSSPTIKPDKAAKPAEKPKPAPNAAKAKTPAQPRGQLGEILAFIAKSKTGYNWKELKTHFPGLSQQARKQLDDAVASGKLRKTGGRYGKPEAKE